MFVFLLQSALLLAIAYVLGAIAGCMLRTQRAERYQKSGAHRPAARPEAGTPEPSVAAASESVTATETAAPAEKGAPKPKAAPRKRAAAKKTTRPASRTAPVNKKAAAAPVSGKDDLKRIKGIGRQIEAKLNAAGITRYEQIAKWTKKDAAEFADKLSFAGRIEREGWVAQAKKLAKGEMTDFAKRVAEGEVATSKAATKRGAAGKGKA